MRVLNEVTDDEKDIHEARAKAEEEARAAEAFRSSIWTLLQALPWVGYRDPIRLNVFAESERMMNRLAMYPNWLAARDSNCSETLREALFNGKLTAIRNFEKIPPEHWVGMSLRTATCAGVWVRHDDVLALWPELTGGDEKAGGGRKKIAVIAALQELGIPGLNGMTQKEREAQIMAEVKKKTGLDVCDRTVRDVWAQEKEHPTVPKIS